MAIIFGRRNLQAFICCSSNKALDYHLLTNLINVITETNMVAAMESNSPYPNSFATSPLSIGNLCSSASAESVLPHHRSAAANSTPIAAGSALSPAVSTAGLTPIDNKTVALLAVLLLAKDICSRVREGVHDPAIPGAKGQLVPSDTDIEIPSEENLSVIVETVSSSDENSTVIPSRNASSTNMKTDDQTDPAVSTAAAAASPSTDGFTRVTKKKKKNRRKKSKSPTFDRAVDQSGASRDNSKSPTFDEATRDTPKSPVLKKVALKDDRTPSQRFLEDSRPAATPESVVSVSLPLDSGALQLSRSDSSESLPSKLDTSNVPSKLDMSNMLRALSGIPPPAKAFIPIKEDPPDVDQSVQVDTLLAQQLDSVSAILPVTSSSDTNSGGTDDLTIASESDRATAQAQFFDRVDRAVSNMPDEHAQVVRNLINPQYLRLIFQGSSRAVDNSHLIGEKSHVESTKNPPLNASSNIGDQDQKNPVLVATVDSSLQNPGLTTAGTSPSLTVDASQQNLSLAVAVPTGSTVATSLKNPVPANQGAQSNAHNPSKSIATASSVAVPTPSTTASTAIVPSQKQSSDQKTPVIAVDVPVKPTIAVNAPVPQGASSKKMLTDPEPSPDPPGETISSLVERQRHGEQYSSFPKNKEPEITIQDSSADNISAMTDARDNDVHARAEKNAVATQTSPFAPGYETKTDTRLQEKLHFKEVNDALLLRRVGEHSGTRSSRRKVAILKPDRRTTQSVTQAVTQFNQTPREQALADELVELRKRLMELDGPAEAAMNAESQSGGRSSNQNLDRNVSFSDQQQSPPGILKYQKKKQHSPAMSQIIASASQGAVQAKIHAPAKPSSKSTFKSGAQLDREAEERVQAAYEKARRRIAERRYKNAPRSRLGGGARASALMGTSQEADNSNAADTSTTPSTGDPNVAPNVDPASSSAAEPNPFTSENLDSQNDQSRVHFADDQDEIVRIYFVHPLLDYRMLHLQFRLNDLRDPSNPQNFAYNWKNRIFRPAFLEAVLAFAGNVLSQDRDLQRLFELFSPENMNVHLAFMTLDAMYRTYQDGAPNADAVQALRGSTSSIFVQGLKPILSRSNVNREGIYFLRGRAFTYFRDMYTVIEGGVPLLDPFVAHRDIMSRNLPDDQYPVDVCVTNPDDPVAVDEAIANAAARGTITTAEDLHDSIMDPVDTNPRSAARMRASSRNPLPHRPPHRTTPITIDRHVPGLYDPSTGAFTPTQGTPAQTGPSRSLPINASSGVVSVSAPPWEPYIPGTNKPNPWYRPSARTPYSGSRGRDDLPHSGIHDTADHGHDDDGIRITPGGNGGNDGGGNFDRGATAAFGDDGSFHAHSSPDRDPDSQHFQREGFDYQSSYYQRMENDMQSSYSGIPHWKTINPFAVRGVEWHTFRNHDPTKIELNQDTGAITPWVAYRPEIGFVINHSTPLGDSATVFDPDAFAGVYHSKSYDHTRHSKLFFEQFPVYYSFSSKHSVFAYHDRVVRHCMTYGV